MDLLLALAVFCAVTLFTPGPNNLMLMTSGLNFGFRRGLPHRVGVVIGRVLKDTRAVRVFNIAMALLLIASLYPIVAQGLQGMP